MSVSNVYQENGVGTTSVPVHGLGAASIAMSVTSAPPVDTPAPGVSTLYQDSKVGLSQLSAPPRVDGVSTAVGSATALSPWIIDQNPPASGGPTFNTIQEAITAASNSPPQPGGKAIIMRLSTI